MDRGVRGAGRADPGRRPADPASVASGDPDAGACRAAAAVARMARTASAVSVARQSAEPTTRTSTPRPAAIAAVSAFTPPSTWTRPFGARYRGRRRDLARGLGHERLAAEPGFHGHDHHDVEERRDRARGPTAAWPASAPARRAGRRSRIAPASAAISLLDLDVERHRVAARVEVVVEKPAWFGRHQVRVERQPRHPSQRRRSFAARTSGSGRSGRP